MGLFRFGPSKQERREMAARADVSAAEDAAEGCRLRAEAAAVRKRGQSHARHIAGHLETNARIAEDNARIEQRAAEQLRRPWWRCPGSRRSTSTPDRCSTASAAGENA